MSKKDGIFKDSMLNTIGLENMKIKLNERGNKILTVTRKKYNNISTKDLMIFLEKLLDKRLHLIDILITNKGDALNLFYIL